MQREKEKSSTTNNTSGFLENKLSLICQIPLLVLVFQGKIEGKTLRISMHAKHSESKGNLYYFLLNFFLDIQLGILKYKRYTNH